MILLAFFFPLAVYLLLLGFLNRCRHPLLVSGLWDGIGLLFGVSGFLFFAGPAVLTALGERWRLFWLLGRGDVPPWNFLALLYFLLVVGGTALYLWRQRHLTAIYNTNADLVERTVIDICKESGINPVRSGALFLFDPSRDRKGAEGPEERPLPYGRGSDSETVVLEVDSFPLMHHVTLRWEPAAAPLRRVVEAELSRRLSESVADNGLLGGWLLTAGFVLLSFDLVGAFFLVLLYLQMLAR
jgi:hypothetical protein